MTVKMKQANHQALFEEALKNCNDEALAYPGALQDAGVLLAVEPRTLKILAASANVEVFGKGSASDILGRSLGSVLDLDSKAGLDLVEGWFIPQGGQSSLIPQTIFIDEQSWQIVVYREAGQPVLVEALQQDVDDFEGDPLMRASLIEASEMVQCAKTLEEVFRLSVEYMARLVGYEHVMLYRFESDWHGVVLSEYCEDASLPRYEGLHFPATDIPERVREMYSKNSVRVIWDSHSKEVPLVFLKSDDTASDHALDLSRTLLRAVSQVHCTYLRNMGVRSSMSVSVMMDGKLWGLITCHSSEPKKMSYDRVVLARLFGSYVSQRISTLEREHLESTVRRRYSELCMPLDFRNRIEGAQEFLDTYHWMIMNWVGATGLLARIGSRLYRFGKCPLQEDCAELLDLLEASSEQEIFHSSSLVEFEWGEKFRDPAMSGILVLWMQAGIGGDCIMWFRPEEPMTVYWAGEPKKDLVSTEQGLRLSPRSSFEAWKEERRFVSRPWSKEDLALVKEFGRRMKTLGMSTFLQNKAMEESRSETLSHVLHDLGNAVVGIAGKSHELDQITDGRANIQLLKNFLIFLTALQQETEFSPELLPNFLAVKRILESNMIDLEKREVQRRRISGELENIIHHVGTLLDVNRRYVSRAGTVEDGECNLKSVLEDVSVFFPPGFKEQGGVFELLAEGEDLEVTVPRSTLERIFINLIKNSIEACSEHGVVPRIECTVTKPLRLSEKIQVHITDNGCGFDPSSNPLRDGENYSTKKKGSGLGLSGCRKLLNQLGGDLAIESSGVGSGAVAYVQLPCGVKSVNP